MTIDIKNTSKLIVSYVLFAFLLIFGIAGSPFLALIFIGAAILVYSLLIDPGGMPRMVNKLGAALIIVGILSVLVLRFVH